jgi:hypothetical protein
MFLLQSLVGNCMVFFFLVVGHLNILFVLFLVFIFHIHSVLVSFEVGDHINVSAIHIFEFTLVRIDSYSHGFENSSDLYTVTRTHLVNHIVIRTQVNGLRRFAFRNTFRSLLHFDVLFVREHTIVVHQFESIAFFAIFAL